MVRERTPARGPSKTHIKNQLGESWVVQNESDGDDEYTPPSYKLKNGRADTIKQSQKAPAPQHSPRKRNVGGAKASAEPELIMPSMHNGSVSGSWLGADEPREDTRHNRTIVESRKVEKRPRSSFGEGTTHDKIIALATVLMDFTKPILLWIYDVAGGALQAVKTPVSFLVAVWLLFGVMVFLRNLFFSSLYSALSPVCRIPGTQYLNLPMCQSSVTAQYSGEEPPPVRFDKLMTVQSKFDEILQESAGGVTLPLEMKRGETSIRDLRHIVRYSQLHSKNEMVLEFDGFIEMARIASYDLQKFNSHVGRGVDNILATARWTKRVLDGIRERDASQGAVTSFLNDKLLAPFQPLKFTESALLDQYIQHTRVVEEEINRLVTEAQALLILLQNLEDRLDVIHGIAVRDNIHAQGSRVEVLSQLWTMLGGNRSKLGKYDSQLRLLGQVDTYRQSAIAHVSGTMLKLQGMGTELEELRERVGGVELLGVKGAVPLSVHIENIEMGVERLERGRRGAKELENEELRKSLDRGRPDHKAIDG